MFHFNFLSSAEHFNSIGAHKTKIKAKKTNFVIVLKIDFSSFDQSCERCRRRVEKLISSSVNKSIKAPALNMSQTTMNNFQFAPLRTLDDFILESARFQVPNFSDFEKWGNRVVKNLLYYQTNYFILSAIELIIIGLVQPTKIVCGFVAIASVLFAILMIYGPNKIQATQPLQNVNKYAVFGLLIGIAYIFLYMFDAVLLVAFAILLPISSKWKKWRHSDCTPWHIIFIFFRYFHSLVISSQKFKEQAYDDRRDNWYQTLANGSVLGSLRFNAGFISVNSW